MRISRALVLLALWVFFVLAPRAMAGGTDSREEASEANALQSLKEELRVVRAELAELRESLAWMEAVRPTLTSLMPDFAERFHVMHRAGDAGDWAVAAHELAELKRLVVVAKAVDPERGTLLEGFMNGVFAEITAAIEHGNSQKFTKALTTTVTNCNACHAAVGSEFITVTLDVEEGLSMRHPHALEKSKTRGAHTHRH